MTTLTDCPESETGALKFRLFGNPVRVTFWFWLAIVLLAVDREPAALLIWVGVCLVSILLHELGHILAYRIFGAHARVVLYGWGGATIPDRGLTGPGPNFMVALAGPAAGFCIAGLTLALAQSYDATIEFGFRMFLPTISAWPTPLTVSNWYFYVLLNDIVSINFYWSLMNLLPVYPLDGFQAARSVFEHRDPRHGKRRSLVLSATVAATAALFGLAQRSPVSIIAFAVLAVSSLQALERSKTEFHDPTALPNQR
jgi:Zn-dependent protease